MIGSQDSGGVLEGMYMHIISVFCFPTVGVASVAAIVGLVAVAVAAGLIWCMCRYKRREVQPPDVERSIHHESNPSGENDDDHGNNSMSQLLVTLVLTT